MAEPVVRCTYTKLVPIAELKAKFHPKNPNVHPDDQLDRLAEIIRYQGIRKAAVLSNRSDLLTAGHGRIVAAERAGAKVYPVDCQDYENEEQEFADLVADNALNDWSDLNLSAINSELPNLGPDFDLDMLGIKDFVLEPADILEPQCDEDEVPENADTRCKPGDVWQLGRHRLMCGDSTAITDVEKLMAGEKADMVFTDPPYGIDEKTDRAYAAPSRIAEGGKFKKIAGDKDTNCAYDSWSFVQGLAPALQIWWGANHYADRIESSPSWIVWDKREEEKERDVNSDCELAWCKGHNKSVRIFRHKWKGLIKASEHGQKRVHPTQKPIALAEWCFENYGDPKLVLDLFGGSGSTLIACEKTNRRCFMMEIDPHYCDVILARWEKYTGKTAERLEEGANV